jgi:hypothetical protein
MGDADSLYYAPLIPPAKEAAARRVHALHLPETEPILVLFDATLFGSATEGFVVTPHRFCWRNVLEHPRQIEWGAIEPREVTADGLTLLVSGGRIYLSGPVARGGAAFLIEMAKLHATAKAGPYRLDAGALSESGPVARLVALARRHLGESEDIYYHPGIPTHKLATARAAHAAHLPAGEEVAVLQDDTLFGSAEDGFLITPTRLCWKALADEPRAAEWRAIDPSAIKPNGNVVEVAGGTIVLSVHGERAASLALLLAAIARGARRP